MSAVTVRRVIIALLAVVGLLAVIGAPSVSASSTGSSGGPVVGTWGYENVPTQPLIHVNADGTVGGNDGCNVFSTTWHARDPFTIVFETDRWISTMRYCEGNIWFPAARTATSLGAALIVFDGHGNFLGVLPRR